MHRAQTKRIMHKQHASTTTCCAFLNPHKPRDISHISPYRITVRLHPLTNPPSSNLKACMLRTHRHGNCKSTERPRRLAHTLCTSKTHHAQARRQHDNMLRLRKSSKSNHFPHITQCSSMQTMSVRVRKAKYARQTNRT